MRRVNEKWNYIFFMSIIMCMGSFTIDWNLSKSAYILVFLPMYIKAKFQYKAKTKPCQISCQFVSSLFSDKVLLGKVYH